MPCPLGLAQAKVGAKKWLTRAEIATLLETARVRLESNLDVPMTTKQLAKDIGLSEHHFIRSFTRQFGRPPRDHRAIARMQVAQALIEQTSLPLNQIAAEVGFASASTFSRQFRLLFGHSPSQARAAAQSANSGFEIL